MRRLVGKGHPFGFDLHGVGVLRNKPGPFVIYHRDPTDDERARLIAEYPDAVEVEAERVALAY